MHEDVALPHRREHVRVLAVLAEEPRLGDGRVRLVAQIGEALEAVERPEIGEVEWAVELVHLVVADAERRHERLPQARAHPRLDLQPHHLAEAAAAELLLDGLHEVVGLVGDVVVGVAGDAEEGVVADLHAREQDAEVVGDEVLEQHEDVLCPLRPEESAEELLRHLHPREDVDVLIGIVEEDAQTEREVGDVGEGAPHPDHERRERREDLGAEQLGELRALRGIGVLGRNQANAVLGKQRAAAPASRSRCAGAGPRPSRGSRGAARRRSAHPRPGRPRRPPPGPAGWRRAPCRTRRGSTPRSRRT